MRILLIHNRYQHPGGEDEVFERERRLLEAHGHSTTTYVRDNAEIASYGALQKIALAPLAVWNAASCRELAELLARDRPDIAHFHNTFPLISPAAYYACREAGVPVVQSLHNPRMLCPAATFYRDGRLCEDCLRKTVPWPGVLHACYRESRLQTGVVASMLAFHHWKGTWQDQVDLYITATEFYRRKFIEGGLPPDKVVVKPHFVSPDPGIRTGPGDYALFVGRQAPEKGVLTLMRAWRELKGIPLQVRGDGPLLGWTKAEASASGSPVKLVPRLSHEAMTALVKGARILVWPSEGYYEAFGLIAVEAFACGVPVIASRIGAMAELVEDGRTGLCFAPGDPEDLAAKVAWAWSHPSEMEAMGRAARSEYEAKYGPEPNYERLMEIYLKASRTRQPQPIEARQPKRVSPAAVGTSAPGTDSFREGRLAATGVDLAPPQHASAVLGRTRAGSGSRTVEKAKVLVVHDFYQQPGGEDAIFAAETELLRVHGHEVVEYREDNDRIEGMNRLVLAANTIWSRSARRDIESLLRRERPDIAHFHNTFPLISPAAYYACKEAGVPVVQTLHNYRLICPAATLHRDGRVCEDCVGKTIPWPGTAHACYRDSYAASATVAAMLGIHNHLGTWANKVNLYIALTEFARRKFIAGGLPQNKIVVKPNFTDIECPPRARPGDYALYLGRLSPEKGIGVAVNAWRQVASSVPLRIAGDGPLRLQLEAQLESDEPRRAVLLGRLGRREALESLRGARFLVVPSECYENFPLVVPEAFATGVPVIAAKLGAMEEIVQDGKTGLLFLPGDARDLACKADWACNHPREMEAMGRAARAEYEAKYTPGGNYRKLAEIYARVARRERASGN